MARVRVDPISAARIRGQIREPVAREMLRRGLRVESAAKRRISASPRRVDTGRLRASILTLPIEYQGMAGARVQTDVEYALYVHDGTRYMLANPFLKDALPAAGG